MKVLSIAGSPRKKGTSTRIAEAFTSKAEAMGAEVEHYYLNGLTYKGCQGCEKCHTSSDRCILKDDIEPALDAMRTADVVVFSTPVYYGDTSGQFKLFFDRTWSHVAVDYDNATPYSSRLPAGKTALFILTQGDEESKHTDVIDRYGFFLDLYGFETKIVRATSLTTGQPDEDVSKAQAEAEVLAEELMKSSKG